jgi:hypothetical protein
MRKGILFLLVSLFDVNAYAGVCNNGTVIGSFNYKIDGVTGGNSAHAVGRIFFNGQGGAAFNGIEATSGGAVAVNGAGTYFVASNCSASGTISWTNGNVTTYWLYLDHMNSAPTVNFAYHAEIVLKSSFGFSGSGTLDRLFGGL